MIHTGDVSKNWKLFKQKLELYANMTNAANGETLNCTAKLLGIGRIGVDAQSGITSCNTEIWKKAPEEAAKEFTLESKRKPELRDLKDVAGRNQQGI